MNTSFLFLVSKFKKTTGPELFMITMMTIVSIGVVFRYA